MKHKSRLVTPKMPGVKISEITERFHPLSYYLLGGTDLAGELSDTTAQVEYDNDEQLAELQAEGASSVALGDPRVSFFDIVETAGVKGAEKAMAKSPNPGKTDITESAE